MTQLELMAAAEIEEELRDVKESLLHISANGSVVPEQLKEMLTKVEKSILWVDALRRSTKIP